MRNSTDMLTSTARSLVSRGCGNNSRLMYHPIGKKTLAHTRKTHTKKQTNKNGSANHNVVFFSFFCLVVAPSMAWRSLVPVPLDFTIGHEDTPAHASDACSCCSLASTQAQCQWWEMKRRAVSLLVSIWSPSRQRLAVFPVSSAHRRQTNWTNWNEGCSTLFCSQSLRSKTSRMRMMIRQTRPIERLYSSAVSRSAGSDVHGASSLHRHQLGHPEWRRLQTRQLSAARPACRQLLCSKTSTADKGCMWSGTRMFRRRSGEFTVPTDGSSNNKWYLLFDGAPRSPPLHPTAESPRRLLYPSLEAVAHTSGYFCCKFCVQLLHHIFSPHDGPIHSDCKLHPEVW